MTSYIDIDFLVDRQSEIRYLTNKSVDGYASSMYRSEQLRKARCYWKKELFKQRTKVTVLPRLQRLEQVLRKTKDSWWDYGERKKIMVYTEDGVLCTI